MSADMLSGRIYVSDGMSQAVLERLGHDAASPHNPLASLAEMSFHHRCRGERG
jgi:hypothetical protein